MIDETQAIADSNIGDALAQARNERGETLAAISEILRIREAHLAALESEEFARLPGKAYVIGFLRTYARYLGLSSNDLIARYKHSVQDVAEDNLGVDAEEAESAVSNLVLIGVVLGALIFIVLVAVLIGNADDAARARSSATGAPPRFETAVPARLQERAPIERPAIPPSTAQNNVAVQATRQAWMRVQDTRGRVLFSGQLNAGERFDFTDDEYIFATRDAGALALYVDGRNIGPLGARRQILMGLRLSRTRIAARLRPRAQR